MREIRSDPAMQRQLARSIALRLWLVVAVAGLVAAGLFRVAALVPLAATLATIAGLGLPVALVALVAVLCLQPADRLPHWLLRGGAAGSVLLLIWVVLDDRAWVIIGFTMAVWVLVVGVIARVAQGLYR